MTEDINVSMWREIDRVFSNIGNINNAKKIRHRYFNSAITDEVFEKTWAIFSAEARQAMEKVYERYEVDPNLIKSERAPRKRGPAVKAPKNFEELKEATQQAKTRKGPKFIKVEGDIVDG